MPLKSWESGCKVYTQDLYIQDNFASCPTSLPATLPCGQNSLDPPHTQECGRFSGCLDEWLPWSWDPFSPTQGEGRGLWPNSQLCTQETGSRTDLVILAHRGTWRLEWDLSGEGGRETDRDRDLEAGQSGIRPAQVHKADLSDTASQLFSGKQRQTRGPLHTWGTSAQVERPNLAAKRTENPVSSHIQLPMTYTSNSQMGKIRYKIGQDNTRGSENMKKR